MQLTLESSSFYGWQRVSLHCWACSSPASRISSSRLTIHQLWKSYFTALQLYSSAPSTNASLICVTHFVSFTHTPCLWLCLVLISATSFFNGCLCIRVVQLQQSRCAAANVLNLSTYSREFQRDKSGCNACSIKSVASISATCVATGPQTPVIH